MINDTTKNHEYRILVVLILLQMYDLRVCAVNKMTNFELGELERVLYHQYQKSETDRKSEMLFCVLL